MKHILILPLFLLLLSACEKTALTTASDSVNRPVVEGYLSPGQVPAVRVTHQRAFASTDTLTRPVEGLEIFIGTEVAEYPLVYSAADILYDADVTWR